MASNRIFSGDAERGSALLVLLVFQNLLNPVSPFLTLALNLVVATHFLLKRNLRAIGFDPYVLWAALAILTWLLFVVVVRGDAEAQVILKYIRITIAIVLFSIVAACAGSCATSIILGLNLALGFHVFLVFAQLIVPDLTFFTAPLFGFEREPTILEQYTLRKLGASSSYDTASLLSIAALLFYYLQFREGRGRIYGLLVALAFCATLFSSRTGMALSFSIVIVIAGLAVLRASPARRIVAISVLAIFSVVAYEFFLPLVLHSLGIAELDSSEVNLIFSAADYGTTGTLDALTQDHLEPLNLPLADLFLGFSIDPNSIRRETDIGYVKLIYHVGIPGTALIILIHIYMLIRSHRIASNADNVQSVRILARLLSLLLIIGLAFNYKSLEIYSRGYGDSLILLFLFLVTWSETGRRRPCCLTGGSES